MDYVEIELKTSNKSMLSKTMDFML
jgi:hypothetical protein